MGREVAVGTRVGLGPSSALPPAPPIVAPGPIYQQARSYSRRSHALKMLALLAPIDSVERLGPALAVSASRVGAISG